MVGLQRPQGDPNLKPEDLEEDNKMICLSNQDEFVLSQVQHEEKGYTLQLLTEENNLRKKDLIFFCPYSYQDLFVISQNYINIIKTAHFQSKFLSHVPQSILFFATKRYLICFNANAAPNCLPEFQNILGYLRDVWIAGERSRRSSYLLRTVWAVLPSTLRQR